MGDGEQTLIDYEVARARMVKEQLINRGITDEQVLRAMGSVPRHLFVDQAFWPRAYFDHPLPIGHEQTISQPYIVALMTQELEVTEGAKVLEIGTGSGYQTAVLAVLGCSVFTVERVKELTQKATNTLQRLGITNVCFRVGDGSLGWEENAPYNGIIVTAGAPVLPDNLLAQLAINGKLVIPIGSKYFQRLIKVIKGENMIEKRDICGCAFVPLVGKNAWNHE